MTETILDQVDDTQTEQGEESQSNQEGSEESRLREQAGLEDVNQDDSRWFFDDETPGHGDKPEWLQSKFKTAAEQAKAYNELEKKFGQFKGAPEEYDLSLENFPDVELSKDDPMVGEFLEFAKESGASQDFVSKTLEKYVSALQRNVPDPQEEVKKLGPGANQEINALKNWANQNFTSDELETLKSMSTTAEQIRLLQKMRNLSTSQNVAIDNKQNVKQGPSENEVKRAIHDDKFWNDPIYRKQVIQDAHEVWAEGD